MSESVSESASANNDLNDEDKQTTLRLKNVVEFGRFSFELEEKREQSIIQQSSQMLTAFSIASAAVLMAVPIIIDNTQLRPRTVLIASAVVLAPLLVSMVLAIISQWRFTYSSMCTAEELLNKAEANKENHKFQAQYDYQWVSQLTAIQNSKRKNNDIRANLIRASTVCFLASVGMLLLVTLVLLLV